MLQRPSSRLLVLDGDKRLLLFRFEHKKGPLAGQIFWATPGGGVDDGETFEDAARRELFEETGMKVDQPGPLIGRRLVSFTLPAGD
jgi:8-oxo-dGTP diphosphatase